MARADLIERLRAECHKWSGNATVRGLLTEAADALAQQAGGCEREALDGVAMIAHFGGLADLPPSEALTAIRRLTLPHWNSTGSTRDQRDRVMAALRAADEAKHPDEARVDWLIDNATTDGGGNGFNLTVFIPHESECIRGAIDAVIANQPGERP